MIRGIGQVLAASAMLSLAARAAQEVVVVATNDFSAVTVRHAEVLGRVFVLSREEEGKGYPARGVRVSVRDPQSDELIAETTTDAEGNFEFPRFDAGRYRLLLGALELPMDVAPESPEGTELPKVIIVVIPEEMARGSRPAEPAR